MRARIGVSSWITTHDHLVVEAVNHAYPTAISNVGGLPFILPVLDPSDCDDVLDGVDGVLLTGGGDLDPESYGGGWSEHVAGTDPARDRWEVALTRAAAERGVPVLGICRGAQVLNAASGGTLHQHLPDVSDHPHRLPDRAGHVVHDIRVHRSSLVRDVLASGRVGVNTLHHQAVDRVGSTLRAVAHAPDGIIEAVESHDGRSLGVQWHPELLTDLAPHARLFEWLVAMAAQARTGRTRIERVA